MNAPPPVAGGAGAQPQTSGLAIASMVLGIASIVLCLGPLAGIPAVIMGHKANSDIRKSGGAIQGGGMATAGLVTGYLSIFMIALWGMMAAVAIPNFVKSRQTAQRNACIKNLQMIDGSKETWALEKKAAPRDPVNEGEVNGYIKGGAPTCPAGGTYTYGVVSQDPTCTIPTHELPTTARAPSAVGN